MTPQEHFSFTSELHYSKSSLVNICSGQTYQFHCVETGLLNSAFQNLKSIFGLPGMMLALHLQEAETYCPPGSSISKCHDKSRNAQCFPVHIKDFASHKPLDLPTSSTGLQ